MSATPDELVRRRAQLVARSDVLREQMSVYCRQLEVPVRVAGTAVSWTGSALGVANRLRQSPLFITALAAVLIRTPWRKMARIPLLAWRGWRLLKFVRSWVR